MSKTNKQKFSWKFYLGILIFSIFLSGIGSFFFSHTHDGLERAIPGFEEKSHHHEHHDHHHHGHQGLVRILGTILIFACSSGSLWLLKKIKSD
ncbi:MAG: hypothetical protein ACQES9_07880 [Myxococcota bacterium]